MGGHIKSLWSVVDGRIRTSAQPKRIIVAMRAGHHVLAFHVVCLTKLVHVRSRDSVRTVVVACDFPRCMSVYISSSSGRSTSVRVTILPWEKYRFKFNGINLG